MSEYLYGSPNPYQDRRTVAQMAATLYPMYLQAELLSSSTQPGAASAATERAVAAARCIWNETQRQMPADPPQTPIDGLGDRAATGPFMPQGKPENA